MDSNEIARIQNVLGLSDSKMAASLGVTRQTWRNWRTGKVCPPFAMNALRWLMELRRVSPSNDNLPERMRFLALILAGLGFPELLDVMPT